MPPQIPEVSGASAFAGHVRELRGDRLGLFMRAAAEVDGLAALRLFGRRVVLVQRPDLLHELLVEKARHFEHAQSTRMLLHPLLGDGLFISEGELWRRQRRLMAPIFTPTAIARHAAAMLAAAGRVGEALAARAGVVDVAPAMMRIAMAVAGAALFGIDTLDDSDELGAAFSEALQWSGAQAGSLFVLSQLMAVGVLRRLQTHGPAPLREPLGRLLARLRDPLLPPGAATRRFRAALIRIDTSMNAVIAERRAGAGEHDDLLARLLRARDEDGAMTDRQVRDEAVTLLVAGHDTTATGLTWTLHLLAQHPEAQARLQAEVDALGRAPTADDAGRLQYCLQVFKESLRLFPPIYAFTREAIDDTTLGGAAIPRGTVLYVSPYTLHRRADLFPAPERFDPERFTPAAEAGRSRTAWLPFGAGPRTCIGMHFALLEGQLVLASLVRRLHFAACGGMPGLDALATLRPAGGMRLHVTPRGVD